MDNLKIGEFLKSLRKAKGLTQGEVADALYVSQKTVSRWETGEGIPDITILTTVATFFDITVDELLNGERKKSNQSDYTNNLKKDNRNKLIINKLLERINQFSIISYAVGGSFIALGLIIGLIRYQTIGLLLGFIGLIASLIIYVIGNSLNKEDIRNADIDLTDGMDSINKEISKKNLAFYKIFFIEIIGLMATFIIFLLMSINTYSLILIMEELALTIGFDLIFILAYKYGKELILNNKIKDYKWLIDKLYKLGSLFVLISTLGILSSTILEDYASYTMFLNIFSILLPNYGWIYRLIGLAAIVVVNIVVLASFKAKSGILLIICLIIGCLGNFFMILDFMSTFNATSPTITGICAVILSLVCAISIIVLKNKNKQHNQYKVENNEINEDQIA